MGLGLAVGLLGLSACFFLPGTEDGGATGDLRAPVATITAPADGFATDQTTLLVTGTASDLNTVTSVVVFGCRDGDTPDRSDPCYPQMIGAGMVVGGQLQAVPADNLTGDFDTWQARLIFPDVCGQSIPFAIRVGTMDDRGNFNKDAAHILVNLDLAGPDVVGPELTIIAPRDGQATGAMTIPVVGKAWDCGTVASVIVDPGTGPVAAESYSGIPGDLDIWLAHVDLTPGVNVVTVTATDDQGNPTVQALNVTLDALADMVLITTPTPFEMGYDSGSDPEQPQHLVLLSDYYLDLYETSFADYLLCYYILDDPANAGSHYCPLVGSEDVVFEDVLIPAGSPKNPFPDDIVDTLVYPLPGREKYPVQNIDKFSAEWFCNWNGGKRLSTEAEWERAARAGAGANNEPDGRLNPLGGNTVDCATANVLGCIGHVLAVNDPIYGANPLGVYHLAGNMMEWVQDFYQDDYYSVLKPLEPVPDPLMDVEANSTCLNGSWDCIVNRGGSYTSSAQVARSTFRNYYDDPWQIGMDYMIGFRCAADGP
ncbi:MAG: hypothetical protein A2V67_13385 [Deltaproteobacteria bacterium RBG_13_61_14]|nr:MAG: hypothetical protein A2V67_13385 [Deltaproteobacteria bacterium RBG_13_61_14]